MPYHIKQYEVVFDSASEPSTFTKYAGHVLHGIDKNYFENARVDFRKKSFARCEVCKCTGDASFVNVIPIIHVYALQRH